MAKSLNCLCLGKTSFYDTFGVIIDEDSHINHSFVKIVDLKISHLKFLVYKQIDHETKINHNIINLWKVNIAYDDRDKLKSVTTEDDIEKNLKGEKLIPAFYFRRYFPDSTVYDENIHIIVQVPFNTTDAPSRIGGLGGTNQYGSEKGHGYEGIDLSCDTICQRKPTIDRLLKCLLKEKIILVRSPPMAGKTAQLFENSLLNSDQVKTGSRRVFRISLMWMDRKEDELWTFAEGFNRLMNITWSEFLDSCDVETFLIVDEVQQIYTPINGNKPLHGGDVFWKVFKNVQQYSNLHIVVFASYGGYHGAYSINSGHSYNVSPCHLEEKNTWGFDDIRFTEEEFKEYFDKFCKKNLSMLDEKDLKSLYHYLYVITGLHPGLTTFTMDKIYEKFVKYVSLSFENIFSYLKSYDFCAVVKQCRASAFDTMTDDEKKLADTVLFMKEGLTLHTELILNDLRIIKTNILVDVSKKLGVLNINFPAPLFRAIYLQERFGVVQRSRLPSETFNEFIASVFSLMSPTIVKHSLGIGRNSELLERVWQMEFYRAATHLLPEDVFVSVDVGEVFGSNGYIDFYIDDKHNWAIELLRDGLDMKGHEKRFLKNGIYESILKVAKQWAIIDIRNNKKRAPVKKRNVDVIYVSCAENFEFVDLKYPDGTKKRVKLVGMKEDLLGFHISDFQWEFQDKFHYQMDIDE